MVLVGDSVSDVQVAHAGSVRVIGHAKNPRRGDELTVAREAKDGGTAA